MKNIVFINTSDQPFVRDIMDLRKPYETRTRNMLGCLVGQDIFIAETGHGKPVIRCSAHISEVIKVTSAEEWEKHRVTVCIPAGSRYDWKSGTKAKYLYKLDNVRPASVPFPADGIRHGRTWMEADM